MRTNKKAPCELALNKGHRGWKPREHNYYSTTSGEVQGVTTTK